MSRRLGISTADFFINCDVPEGTPRNALYDYGLLAAIQTGSVNSNGFWKRFRANADSRIADLHTGSRHIPKVILDENLWESCFNPEPIPETLSIIKQLKKGGHRVVCGTNTLDAHYDVHKRRGDYDIFDAVYASHRMGAIKPNREFWDIILKAEKAEASGAIFIDDNQANVDASAAIGLSSILFTSAESLAETLAPYLKGTPVSL